MFKKSLLLFAVLPTSVSADSSSPQLAGYYDEFLAVCNNNVLDIKRSRFESISLPNIDKVAISKKERFALNDQNELFYWHKNEEPKIIAKNVKDISAGQDGVFIIKTDNKLYYQENSFFNNKYDNFEFIDDNVKSSSIGDSANYYIKNNGKLYVKGKAHRGQYGDGKLKSTNDYVSTANNAVTVYGHTGHALYLSKNGNVYGTGGNYYGPLSNHGLGDKAIRWGVIFKNADSVSTGASDSFAIKDNNLWAWGASYEIEPQKILDNISAIASGSQNNIILEDNHLYFLEGKRKTFIKECN